MEGDSGTYANNCEESRTGRDLGPQNQEMGQERQVFAVELKKAVQV